MEIRTKKWGEEIVCIDEPEYAMKILKIRKLRHTSKHYHPTKKETLFILEGIANIEIWKWEKRAKGCSVHVRLETSLPERKTKTILPNQVHRIIGGTDCTIIEVSTQPKDDTVQVRE